MSKYIKYPKTFHVPWSQSVNSDDKVSSHMGNFIGRRVVVTEKMDGENTTMYNDHIHARSIDSVNHFSRNYVKNMWAEFAYQIPDGFRVCGENLYAKHSIGYSNLKSYFLGFSVWHGNICLSWDETQEWFSLLGVESVPVLYDGGYDEELIKSLYNEGRDYTNKEGYVIRVAESFDYDDFDKMVAKFVRKQHVQTDEHWMTKHTLDINGLKSGD